MPQLMAQATPTVPQPEEPAAPIDKPKILELSDQARKNLNLVSKPAKLQTYWRTVLIPGEIVDRPGLSDRGVTSPAVGVVTQVHAFPGDTIRAGQTLFTLRLFSEYLQNTQSELFKATREIELVQEQVRPASETPPRAVPSQKRRVIELEQPASPTERARSRLPPRLADARFVTGPDRGRCPKGSLSPRSMSWLPRSHPPRREPTGRRHQHRFNW